MADHKLDARGLICPLPVLKARKKLLGLNPGDTLEIEATDARAPEDFRLFCAEAGHEFMSAHPQNGAFLIKVTRSSS